MFPIDRLCEHWYDKKLTREQQLKVDTLFHIDVLGYDKITADTTVACYIAILVDELTRELGGLDEVESAQKLE